MRACFLQAAAKDEWDFQFEGITNHPFIKANYPHHEGIWGWGDVADQVVLMVRNIRRSMVECECEKLGMVLVMFKIATCH